MKYRVVYTEGQAVKTTLVGQDVVDSLLAGKVAFVETGEGRWVAAGAVVRIERV